MSEAVITRIQFGRERVIGAVDQHWRRFRPEANHPRVAPIDFPCSYSTFFLVA